MKKFLLIVLMMLLLFQNTKAQSKRMILLQFSYNSIEVGLEHSVLDERLWAELYTGIANQDLNTSFNDFTSRLGIGYLIFANLANQVSLHTGAGLYFSNNNYYSVTVPFINADIQCAKFFGKTKKHELFFNVGYRYGKSDYKQQYSSAIAKISTIGTFRLTPICFSIGYGFKF